jgi:hypothetical protein
MRSQNRVSPRHLVSEMSHYLTRHCRNQAASFIIDLRTKSP